MLSSLESKPGTIVKETVKMEKTLIRGVAKDTNVATISVIGLKDTPELPLRSSTSWHSIKSMSI